MADRLLSGNKLLKTVGPEVLDKFRRGRTAVQEGKLDCDTADIQAHQLVVYRVAEEYARTALEDDCGPLPAPGQQRPANALAPAAAPTAGSAARPKTKQRMKS